MKNKWIWIGIAGAAVLVGRYFILKKEADSPINHKDFNSVANGHNVDINSSYGKDLASFANNREHITHLAQGLHDAMKGYGTDVSKIREILSNLDAPRFELVYKRFGKRAYGTFGEPTFGNGVMLTLKEWFKRELSDSEYKSLKDKYPRLL